MISRRFFFLISPFFKYNVPRFTGRSKATRLWMWMVFVTDVCHYNHLVCVKNRRTESTNCTEGSLRNLTSVIYKKNPGPGFQNIQERKPHSVSIRRFQLAQTFHCYRKPNTSLNFIKLNYSIHLTRKWCAILFLSDFIFALCYTWNY